MGHCEHAPGHEDCESCASGVEDTAVPNDSGHISFDDTASYTALEDTVVGAGLPTVGATIGDFKLIEFLGEGGMGQVFLAEDRRLGRRVALKILRHSAATPSTVRRFFAEAKAVNSIAHDNIVDISNFFESKRGLNYLVMEYLEGADLAALMQKEGALPLERGLNILLGVCSALEATHQAGIIHRDLKPQNIFLIERNGDPDFVKLLDFGVAKLELGLGDMTLEATAAGVIVGTPEYMSPEQARSRPVDARSDIYSLGVILYQMATGRLPFVGTGACDVIVAHITEEPTPPRQITQTGMAIPVELESLILSCLQKNPNDRPQDIAEVMTDLRRIIAVNQAGTMVQGAEAVGPRSTFVGLERQAKWSGRKGLLAAGAALALGLSLFVGMRINASSQSGGERSDSLQPTAAAGVASMISLRFSSVPEGAQVHRIGLEGSLGTTPFTLRIPRSDEEAVFEYRLDGHVAAKQVVSLGSDSQSSAALLPLLEEAPLPAVASESEPVEPATPSALAEPVAVVMPAPKRRASSKKSARRERAAPQIEVAPPVSPLPPVAEAPQAPQVPVSGLGGPVTVKAKIEKRKKAASKAKAAPRTVAPAPVSLTPIAKLSSPRISGIVDRRQVSGKISGLAGAITQCYKDAYRVSAFTGKLNVQFIIDDSGRSRNVAVNGDGTTKLRGCVAAKFKSSRFPHSTASDAEVRVKIRLNAR